MCSWLFLPRWRWIVYNVSYFCFELFTIFPFTLLNYGFGLTGVRFRTYILWSWLCMLPGTVLYVVGADAVTKGLAEGRVPWVLVGIVVAVAFGLALIVQRARRSLKSHE